MIAKLTDGVLTFAPNKITFTNPEPEMLKAYAGFKDYVEQEKPPFQPETQFLEPSYTETDTQITCTWQVQDLPQPDEQAETR